MTDNLSLIQKLESLKFQIEPDADELEFISYKSARNTALDQAIFAVAQHQVEQSGRYTIHFQKGVDGNPYLDRFQIKDGENGEYIAESRNIKHAQRIIEALSGVELAGEPQEVGAGNETGLRSVPDKNAPAPTSDCQCEVSDNEDSLVQKAVDAYDEQFMKWEEANPGRLPVGAEWGCMVKVVEALRPYLRSTVPYPGFDVLSEEGRAAYRKGYDRGLADATPEPMMNESQSKFKCPMCSAACKDLGGNQYLCPNKCEYFKASEQPVDWTEDAEQENRVCSECGRSYKGDADRALCKACALPPCPDIEPIRKLAREVGYAIGEHGSRIRDYDLIAAPWSDEAVAYNVLIDHLCKGLNAKMIDGITGKPLGRRSCVLQIRDRWLKHIDLSIMPRSTERESGLPHLVAKLLVTVHHPNPTDKAMWHVRPGRSQEFSESISALLDFVNARRGRDNS